MISESKTSNKIGRDWLVCSRHTCFILLFHLLCIAISNAQITGNNKGSLMVNPTRVLANSLTTLQIEYMVGMEGIKPGGGIRFELPVAYGETEPYFWSKPQTESPDLLGFVRASTSTGALMKLNSYGIAGGIFECILIDKSLKEGDKISIEYKGIAQSLARKVEIRYAIRTSANNDWQRISDPPYIEIIPQKAHTLIVTYPADIYIDDTFNMAVVLLDKFGNRATGYRGTIELSSNDDKILIPNNYIFTSLDSGIHVFDNVKFETTGFQTIKVKDTTAPLKISTHYAWVSPHPVSLKRYFGDTHFHTGTGTNYAGFFAPPNSENVNTLELNKFQKYNSGGDHRANFTNARDAYTYARDVVRLDFASSAEHDAILFDDRAWQESQAITTEFYQPDTFTTFYAYEWTASYSHHIVMFKFPNQKVYHRRGYPTLPELWDILASDGVAAITIPHVSWQFTDHRIWDNVDNTYRRLGEIYSLWNNRYLVQPDDNPQRFELGINDKWSYQYAWDKGHKIGVIGSTDNHLGHPGANNYTIYTHHTGGFAAVLSAGNNREDIWDALHGRRTYATTGTRIYLDFQVDGHPMGTEYHTSEAPLISGKVAGTNQLDLIEIVKYDKNGYKVVYSDEPDGKIAIFQFKDDNFIDDCFYYLRVTQVDEYPGRPWSHSTSEMAWSSPVWLSFDK